MLRIDGIQNRSGIENGNTSTIGEDGTEVGKGLGSGETDVPDPEPRSGEGGELRYRILSSVYVKSRTSSNTGVDVALVEVMDALANLLGEVEADRIRINQEDVRSKLEAKLEKLEEASRKIRRAQRKNDGTNIWASVKVAFNMLSALVTAGIGAAMLMGTGGTSPVGWMMVASGLMQALMAADTLTADLTGGYGIAGSLKLLIGGSKKEARMFDLAFRIYLTAAIAVCGIACCFCSPGTVANSAVLANVMQAKGYATVVQSTVTIGTAGADSYFAVREFQAADIRRDETMLRAKALELEAGMMLSQEHVEIAIDMFKNIMANGIESISKLCEGEADTTRALSKVKFTA